jgi:hypothetical protein
MLAASTSARCRPEYSRIMASWTMVSSRWVTGLSTGMRAFSASATITSACSDRASETRTAKGSAMKKSATPASRVVPAAIASVSTISIMAGSARVAIIISRDEPMPPKLVPTSMPASASSARAAPSSATSATTSAAQLNIRPEAKDGTSAAATQVRAKIT